MTDDQLLDIRTRIAEQLGVQPAEVGLCMGCKLHLTPDGAAEPVQFGNSWDCHTAETLAFWLPRATAFVRKALESVPAGTFSRFPTASVIGETAEVRATAADFDHSTLPDHIRAKLKTGEEDAARLLWLYPLDSIEDTRSVIDEAMRDLAKEHALRETLPG